MTGSDPGLAAEHSQVPIAKSREQNGKGQGRRERARNARFRRATDRSGRGTSATGRLDKKPPKKPWGSPPLRTTAAPRQRCPRTPHGLPAEPYDRRNFPTLSLERRISQRHIVVARASRSAHAPPPSETDARASPQRHRPHRARAGQRPRRK